MAGSHNRRLLPSESSPEAQRASKAATERVRNLFSLKAIGNALIDTGFETKDAVNMLVAIIRNPDAKDSDRVRAWAKLEEMGMRALELEGQIVTIEQEVETTQSDGRTARQRVSSRTLMQHTGDAYSVLEQSDGANVYLPLDGQRPSEPASPFPLPGRDRPGEVDTAQRSGDELEAD